MRTIEIVEENIKLNMPSELAECTPTEYMDMAELIFKYQFMEMPLDTMKVQAQLLGLLPELEKGKKFDVTIQEHRNKRSLNANNYSWVLQDKIAQALNRKVDDIHTDMVLQYGV